MAVYTKPSRGQWEEIAHRLGFEKIAELQEVKEGTTDSKFRVTFEGKDGKSAQTMVTVAETPDVHTNGISAERAYQLPWLLRHMALNSRVQTVNGQSVVLGVPSPMTFTDPARPDDNPDPLIKMDFPSNISGQGPVQKVLYVVPYVEGMCLDHEDNILQEATKAQLLGTAHAAWQKSAKGFLEGPSMEYALPVEKWAAAAQGLNRPDAVGKLAARLSQESTVPDDCVEQARQQIDTLKKAVNYVSSHWAEKTRNLPYKLINGDPFPDNTIIDENNNVTVVDNGIASWYKNLDIAMGLNATAMGPGGKLDTSVARAYLNGYNEMTPLTPAERGTLEFMGQAAAIRWAVYRTLLIVDSPEGANLKTRPPTKLLEQYEYWHDAEEKVRKGEQPPMADQLLAGNASQAWRAVLDDPKPKKGPDTVSR